MEVSGKRRDPYLNKGSADATVYCQPCKKGGKRVVAHGFCQTCEEYMCDPCIEAHKRFKVSGNHIMLSKYKMPSSYPSIKQSDIGETEYCKKHPKEVIKFFCPTHSDLGCGDCVVIAHRTCEVDYITDVSKDFVIGKEFRELEPSIKREYDILSGYISGVEELFDEVVNQSKHEIDKLRKFRAEINTYLDRREKELLDNLKAVKTKDENDLTALKTDCKSAMTALEAMRSELSSIDISGNQRYVTARRAQKELRGIHDEMKKMAGRMKARRYRFTKDADTEQLLGSKLGIGTLDMAGEMFRGKSEDPMHGAMGITKGVKRSEHKLFGSEINIWDNKWECEICTYVNPPTSAECEVCRILRPKDYMVPPDDMIMNAEMKTRGKLLALLLKNPASIDS
ncbi:E3 ubiquitin-protein ligase TRIM33-like isoform X2 [Mya arenaria]|nr:E3 ubiquitin-protein ligase TRIM33-like isoform X2 [Mya arenaria]